MSHSEEARPIVRQSVVAHLVVKGGADAIAFYVKAFGAHEMFRMPSPDGRLMHATMAVGNSQFYLCDEFPEHPGSKSPATLGGTPVAIFLNVDDVDASYMQAIAAGAVELMPPADMFWGDRYAQVVDPFGHHWSMAAPVEKVSLDEATERLSQQTA